MFRIQIFGASYGSVLAAKLLLAGHRVSLVCTASEAERINADGISVLIPLARYRDSVRLHSRLLPGELTATTPSLETSIWWCSRCRSPSFRSRS